MACRFPRAATSSRKLSTMLRLRPSRCCSRLRTASYSTSIAVEIFHCHRESPEAKSRSNSKEAPALDRTAATSTFVSMTIWRGTGSAATCSQAQTLARSTAASGWRLSGEPEWVPPAFAPGDVCRTTGLELELVTSVTTQLVTEIGVLVETARQDLFEMGHLAKTPPFVICLGEASHRQEDLH